MTQVQPRWVGGVCVEFMRQRHASSGDGAILTASIAEQPKLQLGEIGSSACSMVSHDHRFAQSIRKINGNGLRCLEEACGLFIPSGVTCQWSERVVQGIVQNQFTR